MITDGIVFFAFLIFIAFLGIDWAGRDYTTKRLNADEFASGGIRIRTYVRFLESISQVKSDPYNSRAWSRFAALMDQIKRSEDPGMAICVQKAAHELYEDVEILQDSTLQNLIIQMRQNLGEESAEFDIFVSKTFSSCGKLTQKSEQAT